MQGQRPPFPHVIDSTIIGAFRSCPQKAFKAYIEHWKPKEASIHLHAGAAFARGLEVARKAFYDNDQSEADSIAAGMQALFVAYGDQPQFEGSTKNLDRMAGALEFYFEHYPMATDAAKPTMMPSGKRAIEFSFAQPLPLLHPESGDPLIYSGRSDMIADFADGIFIEDDKTASQLGASWSKQWDLRSQFTGYCWAARSAGIKVNGVLVRGVSILKTKYDTLQAVTYRSDWEIDRWHAQLLRDLQRMMACWREGIWDYNLDHACTEYGGCDFTQVCKSPDPMTWLPVYFEKRVWDPLERTEKPLEEGL